jgi:hypothetical protein
MGDQTPAKARAALYTVFALLMLSGGALMIGALFARDWEVVSQGVLLFAVGRIAWFLLDDIKRILASRLKGDERSRIRWLLVVALSAVVLSACVAGIAIPSEVWNESRIVPLIGVAGIIALYALCRTILSR